MLEEMLSGPMILFTLSAAFVIVFAVSLIRFTFFRQWRKEDSLTIGSSNYYYQFVENTIWHYRSRVSGIIITLPKHVPHIILDSVSNDMKKDLGITIAAGQQLLLEGDFNNKFIAFTPKSCQSEAREILAPDVMSVLDSEIKDFELEFYQDKLLIITPETVKDNKTLQKELLDITKKLLYELDHKFKTYQSPMNNSENLNITSAGVVRLFGKYISPVQAIIGGIAFFVVLPTLAASVYALISGAVSLFMVLFLFSLLIGFGVFIVLSYLYKQTYRKKDNL